MRCPACDTPNPPESERCQKCGKRLPPRPLREAAVDEDDEEEVEVARRRPDTESTEARRRQAVEIDDEEEEEEDEARPQRRPRRASREGPKLIPYQNPRALISYYCGFFAFIPGLGILLGIAAIILGIMGVRYAQANPKAKGTAHGVVGIVLGLVTLIYNPIILYLLWDRYGRPAG